MLNNLARVSMERPSSAIFALGHTLSSLAETIACRCLCRAYIKFRVTDRGC